MLSAAASAPPPRGGAQRSSRGRSEKPNKEKTKRSRPDVAARMKRKKTITIKAVKMRLSTWCKSPAIQKELERVARGVTRTAVEASRLVNMWALKTIEDEKEIPEMNQTFFYRAFTVVSGSRRNEAATEVFGKALEKYESMRPPNMERFNPHLVTQVLNEAGTEYLTACKNHVVLSLTARVRKGFLKVLEDEYPGMRAPDKKKLTKHLIDRLSRRSTAEEEEAVWNSLRDPVNRDLRGPASTYMAREETRDLPLDDPNAAGRVQRAWWRYLPWLRDLQVIMEDRGGKQFSLLPLCSLDVKHVRVTTTILYDLMKRIRKGNKSLLPDPGKWVEFRDNARAWWERFFRLGRVEGRSQRKTFEESFVTDAYGVSVTVSIPLGSAIETTEEEETSDTNPKDPKDIVPELASNCARSHRVVSVDPGSRDIVTCLSYDAEGNQKTWRYSKKEYKAKIGVVGAQRRRRMWRRKAGLEEDMLFLPSGKTGDIKSFHFHVEQLFRVLDRVLELNFKRRVREMRFTQYGKKQKVMHDICERVIRGGGSENDGRKVTIAYGNATFTTKGSLPGPVKAVRRELQRRGEDIHLVNEDYTSMLCSSCHERLEPMFDEEGRAIHAVRRCHNSECNRMVWHRDVNACLNIMWVFIREQLDGFRPPVFTRAFQQQQHVF